jgi:hypothetical protein
LQLDALLAGVESSVARPTLTAKVLWSFFWN